MTEKQALLDDFKGDTNMQTESANPSEPSPACSPPFLFSRDFFPFPTNLWQFLRLLATSQCTALTSTVQGS